MIITRLSLHDPRHESALLTLMNDYACSVEGGGRPLEPQARESLPAMLATCPTYIGLLAFRQGEPAGILNAFWSVSTFKARRLLNIHDLAVAKTHRRHGVGLALLTEIEAVARTLDCCKLTLEVLSGNTGACRLYEARGFAAYQLDPSMGDARFMQKWI
ncbi:MAG: GNAT family N-acetyltransferase [Burkholderiaceae bacterium]